MVLAKLMPVRPTRFKAPAAGGTVARYTPQQLLRNTHRWQRAARAVLRRTPLCCDPYGLHDGVVAPATEVHHIQPLSSHPHLAFESANLAGLCDRCHNFVEATERRGVRTQLLVLQAKAHLETFGEPIRSKARPREPLSGACRRVDRNDVQGVYCERLRSVQGAFCGGCNYRPPYLQHATTRTSGLD